MFFFISLLKNIADPLPEEFLQAFREVVQALSQEATRRTAEFHSETRREVLRHSSERTNEENVNETQTELSDDQGGNNSSEGQEEERELADAHGEENELSENEELLQLHDSSGDEEHEVPDAISARELPDSSVFVCDGRGLNGGVKCFAGHRHNVPAVCFSPDGLYIASTSVDCTVKIWLVHNIGVLNFLAGQIKMPILLRIGMLPMTPENLSPKGI